MTTNKEIAKTIMAQLGNQAFAMVGAKQFVALPEQGRHLGGLQFRIGRGAKQSITFITIKLNGLDLYDLTFYNRNFKEVSSIDGIYCDQLHDIIEDRLGMYLSLAPRR